MLIDRIAERATIRQDGNENLYINSYEVIEKITNEVVMQNSDLVNAITLNEIPQSALESNIIKIINNYNYKVIGKTRKELIKDIFNSIFGYDMIQKYLDIEGCNGVFINGPNNVWVKIGRELKRVDDISFGNNENLTHFIKSIAAKLGGEINSNKSIAKFGDKENKLRIVATIDPVANISPLVTFRKQPENAFTLDDLVKIGMLTKELAHDLIRYTRAGANIIFGGKGGAGKTTLLGALIEEVEEEEQILIMQEENSAEIHAKHPGARHKEVRRNEKGHISGFQELTDYGLLESIDRYVFGELRGSETFYFFDGAYSGNITTATIHSKNARHTVRKAMINMKKSGTDIKDDVLIDMLYECINIIVYMDSFTVTEVVEVVSESEEKFNDLWRFKVDQREATFITGKHEKVNDVKSEELIEKLRQKNLLNKGEKQICGF